MNVRHELFCQEYARHRNAAKAAVAAGYDEEYAKELVRMPAIIDRINDLLAEIVAEIRLDREALMREMLGNARRWAVSGVPGDANAANTAYKEVLKRLDPEEDPKLKGQKIIVFTEARPLIDAQEAQFTDVRDIPLAEGAKQLPSPIAVSGRLDGQKRVLIPAPKPPKRDCDP